MKKSSSRPKSDVDIRILLEGFGLSHRVSLSPRTRVLEGVRAIVKRKLKASLPNFSPSFYWLPTSPLLLTLEAARVLLLYFKAIMWLSCQKKA